MMKPWRKLRCIIIATMLGVACAWSPAAVADSNVTAITVDFGTRYRTPANPHPWRITAVSTFSGDVTAKYASSVRVGFEGEVGWDSDQVMLSHAAMEQNPRPQDLAGANPFWHRGEITIDVPCGVTGIVFGGIQDDSSFPSNGMDVRARFNSSYGPDKGGEVWFWQDWGLVARGTATQLYQLSGKAGPLEQHATPDTALRLYKSRPEQYGAVVGIPSDPTYRDYDKLLFNEDADRTLITLSAYGFDDFTFDKVTLLCLIKGAKY